MTLQGRFVACNATEGPAPGLRTALNAQRIDKAMTTMASGTT